MTDAGARDISPLLVVVLALLISGCNKTVAPAPAASTHYEVSDSPFRNRRVATGQVNPSAVLLQAGNPSLAMIFDGGGNIRIVDADAKAELVKSTVAPETVIVLDPDNGITIGRERISRAPLHADHRYEIWWDAPAISGGTPGRVVPERPAATRPSAPPPR